MNNLIKENGIIIDKPKGARHQEYTNVVSEFMRAMIIEKNAPIENLGKDIHPIENKDNFREIYEVFEDVIYDPAEEKVMDI
ncbi:MAG: hypothetical protein LBL45_00945 [Treponema sp.]|nr:hypothetical protein [Treponema sp.]